MRPRLRTDFGCAYVAELGDFRQSAIWRAICSKQRKDHRFVEITEQTINQVFEYHYLVLEDHEGTVRGLQPLFLHRQDLLAGTGPHIQRLAKLLRAVGPGLLTMRTLMVGLPVGEGSLGAAPQDEEWCARALHAALAPLARLLGTSLVVLKEFAARYRPVLACFASNGYTRMASMPYTVLELDFRSFDEYMQRRLSKSFRKSLRRKFKDAARAQPISMQVVSDITPYVDEVYPLYLQVYERSKLRFELLTPEYLCRLGREMPDKVRFFIWRQGSRVVAFSVCMVHDGAMWDEYIGLDYGVALDLHLYFYTLRDLINWGCQQGLQRYYSSPLNYDPKLHLKCDLVPMDLYIMHTNVILNWFLKRAIGFLGPTRSDPTLRKFRNAGEL